MGDTSQRIEVSLQPATICKSGHGLFNQGFRESKEVKDISLGGWLYEYLHRPRGISGIPARLSFPPFQATQPVFSSSGLLHPRDYSTSTIINEDNTDGDDDEVLLDMPDTTIAFQFYLIHDAVAQTPFRRKGKQRQMEEVEDYPEESEDDLEKWKMEVRARFIRALHELDYIDLIKHTSRKADHVMGGTM
ncbi:hypothetical protein PAXINDRAFT_19598 [Paxillus involutus ATCC 200175]|uniref:Origin recognition complex subunit 3 winged helix C-terminal domain-containing protein n=1 Tax=Paxillus involutus ATCC 200175 TaxID=664439 RepID=A0A0C9TIT5_PAXIN|nr:hypothetical protein PAXINDRAFT_19598 [Paxillus involutus ATCC 200175]